MCRHDRPGQCLLWRRNSHRTRRSNHTLPLRLNALYDLVRGPRLRDLTLIDAHDVVVDGASVDKGLAVHDRHAVVHALIHVSDVGDMIDSHVVVNIRDLHVRYTGIRDVDVLDISRTGAIPGNVNFSGC
jgi:hypothetical protein